MLRLHPVDSSSIDTVGYDESDQRLYVRFRDSGDGYVYLGVPQDVFDELMQAESKGSFLNLSIKGRYPFRKLSRPPR